jgi:hypothetical protein
LNLLSRQFRRILSSIWLVGVPVTLLVGIPGPHLPNGIPTNDPLSQLESRDRAVFCRLVSSQYDSRQNDGLLLSTSHGHGWLIRATGSTMLRNTPTPRSVKSKTVPSLREKYGNSPFFSSSKEDGGVPEWRKTA